MDGYREASLRRNGTAICTHAPHWIIEIGPSLGYVVPICATRTTFVVHMKIPWIRNQGRTLKRNGTNVIIYHTCGARYHTPWTQLIFKARPMYSTKKKSMLKSNETACFRKDINEAVSDVAIFGTAPLTLSTSSRYVCTRSYKKCRQGLWYAYIVCDVFCATKHRIFRGSGDCPFLPPHSIHPVFTSLITHSQRRRHTHTTGELRREEGFSRVAPTTTATPAAGARR